MNNMIPIIGDITYDTLKMFISELHKCEIGKPITLLISTDGGDDNVMFAIYDLLKANKVKVNTVALGNAESAGAFLLAIGDKGHRYTFPNTNIMMHETSYQLPYEGESCRHSSAIQYVKMMETNEDRYTKIMSAIVNKPYDQVRRDNMIDNYMTPEEAIKYGICDKIITNMEEIK